MTIERSDKKRASSLTAFYIGHNTPVRLTFYRMVAGVKRPLDLTAYTSVKLQAYLADGDASLHTQFTLTVLTDDADKTLDSDGTTLVAATAAGDVAFNGAAQFDVILKLVGTSAGDPELLGKPWDATVYLAGPVT